VFQHDLSFADAAKNYTLLAIGDGLVAQIPALIISIAAGIIVSRVSTEQDISSQLLSHIFSNSQVLYITGGILGLMGMTPGMPHFVFILLAAGLITIAWRTSQQQGEEKTREQVVAPPMPEPVDASWADVEPVDTLGLEVGYRLIPLVDTSSEAELVKRIKGIRKKFAREIGFLAPAVHIRDNLEIHPNSYRITLKGVEIASGEVQVGQLMAIDPGNVSGSMPGAVTREPAFGLPAVWIDNGMREQAQSMGYTVVDAGTVIATHLNHVVSLHAAELLGRQEVQQLLDHLSKDSPKLVEDLVPKLLPLSTLQKILQNLLSEGVHIRDMRTIVEALAEHAVRIQDPHELTAIIRVALGRSIVQQIYGREAELPVMSLEQNLERLLMQAMNASGENGIIEPGLATNLMDQAGVAVNRQEALGQIPVLLVPAVLRPLLSRFLRRALPQLKVLSHAEIPDGKNIRVTSLIGGAV
jgi:flagellar biosynthesis protein FlhA